METKEAILLVGGRGTRIRDFTDGPKCMVPVNGIPFIEYQLDWLNTNDYKKAVLACAYKPDDIKFYLGDSYKGIEIAYSIGTDEMGTGGAAKYASRLIDSDEFLLANGDEFTDLELKHIESPNRIVLSQVRSRFGTVEIDKGKVVGFNEKPLLPDWVSMGIYFLRKDALLVEKGSLERDVFPVLAKKRELKYYIHNGTWLTVNSLKDLEELEAFLNS